MSHRMSRGSLRHWRRTVVAAVACAMYSAVAAPSASAPKVVATKSSSSTETSPPDIPIPSPTAIVSVPLSLSRFALLAKGQPVLLTELTCVAKNSAVVPVDERRLLIEAKDGVLYLERNPVFPDKLSWPIAETFTVSAAELAMLCSGITSEQTFVVRGDIVDPPDASACPGASYVCSSGTETVTCTSPADGAMYSADGVSWETTDHKSFVRKLAPSCPVGKDIPTVVWIANYKAERVDLTSIKTSKILKGTCVLDAADVARLTRVNEEQDTIIVSYAHLLPQPDCVGEACMVDSELKETKCPKYQGQPGTLEIAHASIIEPSVCEARPIDAKGRRAFIRPNQTVRVIVIHENVTDASVVGSPSPGLSALAVVPGNGLVSAASGTTTSPSAPAASTSSVRAPAWIDEPEHKGKTDSCAVDSYYFAPRPAGPFSLTSELLDADGALVPGSVRTIEMVVETAYTGAIHVGLSYMFPFRGGDGALHTYSVRTSDSGASAIHDDGRSWGALELTVGYTGYFTHKYTTTSNDFALGLNPSHHESRSFSCFGSIDARIASRSKSACSSSFARSSKFATAAFNSSSVL
ncbi:MAG: hypothetical protein ACHREM_11460 [Polyangiales bacterium]